MSLFAELQRRSVFKVGAAYLVVAWLAAQAAGLAFPTFEAPAWALRVFIFVLAIGFPVALVLAWVLDATPEGLKVDPATAGNKRMFTIAAVLAALAIGWFLRGMPGEGGGGGASARSIAVLPFANMSGDPNAEYFSDGISEEILNVLARTPELQVAARTSSFGYKGKTDDIPRIARELKVRMVLEGSVRKQGERVRITAQLIDAETGYHAWSQTYDRDLKDIFAIQDEIARAIGNELKVRVGGTNAGGSVSGTTNVAAHDLYLRGLAQWQERREAALWQAVQSFEQAIAQDPKYAQAYGGLALVYAVLPDYSNRITYAESSALVRDSAERALVLDPTLPEPYAALGNAAGNERRFTTSKMLFARAIELRPSFATAHQWLGNTLLLTGEVEGSLPHFTRAVELDPRAIMIVNNYAWAQVAAEHAAEGIAFCERANEWASASTWCHQVIGWAHLQTGDLAKARSSFDRVAAIDGGGRDAEVAALFDALEGRSDRAAFARRLAAIGPRDALAANSGNMFGGSEIVALLVLLREKELAIRYLEGMIAEDNNIPEWAMILPIVDPIRCDPRFVAVASARGYNDSRAIALCGAGTPPATPAKAGT